MSRRRIAEMLFIGAATLLMAGCAERPVESHEGAAPATQTIYVAALGWHTEIGLRADVITGPLAALEREFPDARYFTFGWGDRGYYMAPDPDFADLLRALVPGPAVMLIRSLDRTPAEAFGATNVYAVPVTREGLDRLSQYLWRYLNEDGQGGLRRAGDGPYRESAFYAAAGTYSVLNTCNTWTAKALNVAGLPVSATGVIFSRQVVDRVRGLAVPAPLSDWTAWRLERNSKQTRDENREYGEAQIDLRLPEVRARATWPSCSASR